MKYNIKAREALNFYIDFDGCWAAVVIIEKRNLKIAIVMKMFNVQWNESAQLKNNSFKYINSNRHMRMCMYCVSHMHMVYVMQGSWYSCIGGLICHTYFVYSLWFLFSRLVYFSSFRLRSSFCVVRAYFSYTVRALWRYLITSDRVNECNLRNVSFFFPSVSSFDNHLIAMRNGFGTFGMVGKFNTSNAGLSWLCFFYSVIKIIGVYETVCSVYGRWFIMQIYFCPSDDWQSDRSIDSDKFKYQWMKRIHDEWYFVDFNNFERECDDNMRIAWMNSVKRNYGTYHTLSGNMLMTSIDSFYLINFFSIVFVPLYCQQILHRINYYYWSRNKSGQELNALKRQLLFFLSKFL